MGIILFAFQCSLKEKVDALRARYPKRRGYANVPDYDFPEVQMFYLGTGSLLVAGC